MTDSMTDITHLGPFFTCHQLMTHWLYERSFRNIDLEFDDLFPAHSCSIIVILEVRRISYLLLSFFTKGHLPSLSFSSIISFPAEMLPFSHRSEAKPVDHTFHRV